MAHLQNSVDIDAPLPSALVVWVDKKEAFQTHLASVISALQTQIMLKTFIETNSAMEAMSAAVSSCQNGSKETRKQRIACVITNMRRSNPLSGLQLLQKMKNVFLTNVLNNGFSSFPPTVVYSASATQNSSLADACRAAGAMLVLSNNVDEIQRIIMESVFPSISLNFLLNPILQQRTTLSRIPSEYYPLFSSHCLSPLPDKYGGKLTDIHGYKLVLLEWRLLYDVLLHDTLKAFESYCASNKHYISGGLAINHWLQFHGFPSLLTNDCDFRFESKDNIKTYANQMKSVLEKHTQTIRVNMAHLGIKCSDPELITDSNGCRVYFPLRYYDSSAAASEQSCYEFMWKVFDVSHNWKSDPIDIIQEHGLCYIGRKEILKELTMNYGQHKEQRRQLRLKFINFVLHSS